MSSLELAADAPTRDRISACAATLFADHGFAGVSMRDIADAVGIKAASLYNHFADKEELYFAALERGFAERVEDIEKGLDATGTAEERLKATVIALARTSADDNVSRKLLHRELMDGDRARLERLTKSLFNAPYSRMVQLFGEVSPNGDARSVTAHINALITGYFLLQPVLRQLDPDLPMDPDIVGNQFTELLLANLHGGAA